MAISYTATGVVITDDRNPDRAPLVLPAGATIAEVGAAVTAYLDLPPQPDFDSFGLWLLTNPDVAFAYDLAFDQAKLTSCTLPSAVLAAASGETKHLRTALLLLRRRGLLSDIVIAVMLAKARECNLPDEFLSAIGS